MNGKMSHVIRGGRLGVAGGGGMAWCGKEKREGEDFETLGPREGIRLKVELDMR